MAPGAWAHGAKMYEDTRGALLPHAHHDACNDVPETEPLMGSASRHRLLVAPLKAANRPPWGSRAMGPDPEVESAARRDLQHIEDI